MEFTGNKAIYLQIVDFVFENILNSKYPPGERILSVREFAVEIQVNPNTVMRSYQYLQDENVIYNKRGIGFFVADNAVELVMELKRKEFINSDLPAVFKTMKLLNISFKELKEIYDSLNSGDKQ